MSGGGSPADIVGYAYKADLWCFVDIVEEVAHDHPEAAPHDGTESGETYLNRAASALGIDRENEHSFDSDDFPKVVLREHLEGHERCATCHDRLEDE